MADPSSETARRSLGRGGRIVLFMSLALNLIVVGLVVGALVMGGGRDTDRRPPRGGETGLGPVLMALTPEDRRTLGRDMRRALRQAVRNRGETRALARNLAQAMRAEPYDSTRIDDLVAAQFEDVDKRLSIARELFLTRAAAMSPEERAAFADRLVDILDNPPQNRRGLDGPRGDRPQGPRSD